MMQCLRSFNMSKDTSQKNKPIRDDFLVFGSPKIEQPEIDEVVKCLKSGWVGTGPRVSEFENNFRDYIGSKYAVALNSCTAALHLSMLVSEITPGDEVITTPMTFTATANAIIHAGAKPIFVDIEKNTMNIDPDLIEKAITPKTKAILPVHFAGRPCNMTRIMEIAQKNDLLVIEDAAHAIEAEYKGKKIGNIGDMTCFSFYVTKNLVTGEGGMVTTNREDRSKKVKIFGLHGMSNDAWKRYSDKTYTHYEVITPGFKYNMMDIQASLGIHQLKRIEKNFERRKEIWDIYNKAFEGLPMITPSEEKDTVHARHLYTLLLDLSALKISRDEFMSELKKENIGIGVHYISLHLQSYYKETFGFKKDDFPNASFISERTISIPFSAKLSDKDVKDVIDAITKVAINNMK
jgi:dTDP-4-amino-4,6-dideoxygalactose transaminase